MDKTRVLSVKSLLPAGPIAFGQPSSGDGNIREHDLIQVWCDPGGMRTLSAAGVFLSEKLAREYMSR